MSNVFKSRAIVHESECKVMLKKVLSLKKNS